MTLDNLKPEVREAVEHLDESLDPISLACCLRAHRTIHAELVRLAEIEANAVGAREDADFWKERAELVRLAAENARLLATVKFRSEAAEAAHGNWQAEFERAERAESELAALKARIAEAPVGLVEIAADCLWHTSKRVRLLLDE